jgi:hypothetical protein
VRSNGGGAIGGPDTQRGLRVVVLRLERLDMNYLIGLLAKGSLPAINVHEWLATVNESDFEVFVPHGLKLAVVPPAPSLSAPPRATGS